MKFVTKGFLLVVGVVVISAIGVGGQGIVVKG